MKFIDEAKIFLKAGDGGNGCLSFRREKYLEFGGPDGGNGGDGGHILLKSDSNVNTLLKFRYQPHLKAKRGSHGGGARMTGMKGADLICTVPVGTEILTLEEELLADLKEPGQEFLIAAGGKGGRGNSTFKSATQQAPRSFTYGTEGEEKTVLLKLKILADIGLVGLPNAGKSTFLSLCSNAKPKIADYPFSTLEPSLGIVKVHDSEIIMADIPGIIGGAHMGAGLGHQFLRHIERCKILLYIIDITTENVNEVLQILVSELTLYNRELEKKPSLILLTKCDLIEKEEITKRRLSLKGFLQEEGQALSSTEVLTVSMAQDLRQALNEIHKIYSFTNIEPKKIKKFDPLENGGK